MPGRAAVGVAAALAGPGSRSVAANLKAAAAGEKKTEVKS